MAYILSTILKPKKRVRAALRDLFGIGCQRSQHVCDSLGVTDKATVAQLSASRLDKLSALISQLFIVGTELQQAVARRRGRLSTIGSYRGFRHVLALPSRGGRTHGNARTTRRLGGRVKVSQTGHPSYAKRTKSVGKELRSNPPQRHVA